MVFTVDFDEIVFVIREIRIGFGSAAADDREVEAVGDCECVGVNLPPPDDEYVGVVASYFDGPGYVLGPDGAGCLPIAVSCDHDVFAAGERSAGQGVECLAPHDQGVAHRERFEAAEVVAKVVEHVTPEADGPVEVDCGYDVYHTETSAFMCG